MPPRKSSHIRAVNDNEAPPKPKTITAAAADGDYLAMLKATLTRIAHQVEDPNCPSRDLASLSRRMIEIAKEIDAIEIQADQDQSVVANTDDEAWDGTGY